MEKTIRMPKELLAKWLAALRSGEYEQCTGGLYDGYGYCCLGVLVCVADNDPKPGGLYPSPEWTESHGITFYDSDGNVWNSQPYLPMFGRDAGDVNDDLKKPFAEIADAIEACAEGYDP